MGVACTWGTGQAVWKAWAWVMALGRVDEMGGVGSPGARENHIRLGKGESGTTMSSRGLGWALQRAASQAGMQRYVGRRGGKRPREER